MKRIVAVWYCVLVSTGIECMHEQLAGQTPASIINTAQRLLAHAPMQTLAIPEQTTAIAYLTEHRLSGSYLQEVITYLQDNQDIAIASDQGALNLLYHMALQERMITTANLLAYDATQSQGCTSCMLQETAAAKLLEESTRTGKSAQKIALERIKAMYEEVSVYPEYSRCQRYESMRFMITLKKAKSLLKHDIAPLRKYWKPLKTPFICIAAGFLASYLITQILQGAQALMLEPEKAD